MNFLNKIISIKFFSIYLKAILLLFLIIIVYIGFQGQSTSTPFLKQLRNFNLGNLMVWSYWWPFLVVSSIFLGRIWCMMCPVELITSLAAKMGFKKNQPQWLKSGWVITILYAIILFIGINGFAIHRNPKFMAIYLLLLLGLSVIVGFAYKRNTFCKDVCPIGILLGIYSRFSFLGWRVKLPSTCDSCNDKSCISSKNTYKIDSKSCGVELYPAKIISNTDCILCGGCRKACSNNNVEKNTSRPNPGFEKVIFKQRLFSNHELSFPQVAFTVILSGFVIYEILSEWSVTKGILMHFPDLLNQQFDVSNSIISGLIKSIFLFVILPLILWVLPYFLGILLNIKLSFGNYLKTFAASFIPIMAAGHICKSLLKTTSRLPYFEHVFNDIGGMANTQKFLDGSINLFSVPDTTTFIVSVMLLFFLVLGGFISIYTVNRINKLNKYKNGFIFYLIPVIYTSIFIVPVIIWRFL